MNKLSRRAVGLRVRTHAAGDDAGQALVEFALILPILLILVIGILEFGRAWNAYQVITDAAREGARNMVVAGVPATEASVNQVVNTALFAAALDSTKDVTTLTGLRTGTGTTATVRIAYPYGFTFLGRLLSWTTGQSNITLRTSFVMRNE